MPPISLIKKYRRDIMQVVGNIVDKNYNLIGFILRGKETEFGGYSDAITEKRVPFNSIPNGFKATGVRKINNRIETVGDFKINSLDRMELSIDNKLEIIPNTITIKKVYTDGENIIGFNVDIGNKYDMKLRKEEVANRASWFKPTNFIVAEMHGKIVIKGKQGGTKISDLPTIDITDDGKKKKNGRMNPVQGIKNISEYKEVKGVEVDILSIYKYVEEHKGHIIKLPSDRYTARTSGAKVEYGENGFIPNTRIEIASPICKFGDTKLNATLSFRRTGTVKSIETSRVYDTYIFVSKSVFYNGESTLNSIGIAIDAQSAQNLIQSKLKCKIIDDADIQREVREITGKENLVIIEVSLDNVGILEDSKRSSFILNNEQIKVNCLKAYELKLMSKYLSSRGTLMKGIKERLGDDEYYKLINGGLYYKFKNLSEIELNDINNCGISIYTGDYKKYQEQSNYSVDNSSIMIEYIYGNLDTSKISGKDMVKMAAVNDTRFITKTMVDTINLIEHMKLDSEKIETAKNIQNLIDTEMRKINTEMWMHRAAMFLEGRKKYIHQHDKESWVPDINSRARNYNVYVNSDLPELKIKFKGVAI